jgi:hypothetical protein
MIVETEPLFDKKQTSDKIKKIVAKFYTDLAAVEIIQDGEPIRAADMDLNQFYNFVRSIPYRRDKKPREIIARPFLILKHNRLGMDCKKKTILIGAWARWHNIPCRYIGSSTRADHKIHHIFPQLKISGDWINVDATYPEYRIGEKKVVTKAEIL